MWDAHLCWLRGNSLEFWDCFRYDARQDDFNGKRENQSKTLMAVRHNLVEATAVVALAVALQKCISHQETHTYQHVQNLDFSMWRRSKAQQNKSEQSEIPLSLSHAVVYQRVLWFWCLHRGKKWEKNTNLNKYLLFLTHWGGINQTLPQHVNPQFTTLLTVRIIAIRYVARHRVLNSLGGLFQMFFALKKTDDGCERRCWRFHMNISSFLFIQSCNDWIDISECMKCIFHKSAYIYDIGMYKM